MSEWDDGETHIPLSREQMVHAEYLAARMMGGILAVTKDDLTVSAFAAVAVEMAFAVMNETRRYCLKDSTIQRKPDA